MSKVRGKNRSVTFVPCGWTCVTDLTPVTAAQNRPQDTTTEERSPHLPRAVTGQQEAEFQGRKGTGRSRKQTHHFTNEETEAQRAEATYLRLLLWGQTVGSSKCGPTCAGTESTRHSVLGWQQGEEEGDPTAPGNKSNRKDLRHS